MAKRKAAKKPVPPPVDPARMTLPQAAALFTKVGGEAVTEDLLASLLAAGAPANDDGTLHLVRLAAWLSNAVR